MGLTERDKKFYDFLVSTRLPMTITDVAKMFYPSVSNNERSSIVVAQRRCRALVKMDYIECSKRNFGESNYYYVGVAPAQRTVRHKLTMSSVIAKIATSGFEILEIEPEYSFSDYGIVSDLYMTCKYANKPFIAIVEVDLTKDLNPNYKALIEAIRSGKLKFKYPVYFLSVSDFKIKDDFLKKYFINVKTDLSDFEKFKYAFIK